MANAVFVPEGGGRMLAADRALAGERGLVVGAVRIAAARTVGALGLKLGLRRCVRASRAVQIAGVEGEPSRPTVVADIRSPLRALRAGDELLHGSLLPFLHLYYYYKYFARAHNYFAQAIDKRGCTGYTAYR